MCVCVCVCLCQSLCTCLSGRLDPWVTSRARTPSSRTMGIYRCSLTRSGKLVVFGKVEFMRGRILSFEWVDERTGWVDGRTGWWSLGWVGRFWYLKFELECKEKKKLFRMMVISTTERKSTELQTSFVTGRWVWGVGGGVVGGGLVKGKGRGGVDVKLFPKEFRKFST